MQYQYLKFYQEVADFTESIGLSNKGGLRGLTEAEILDYEKENNITFGEEYRIALKILGKRKGQCLIYMPPNFNTLNKVKNQEIEYRIDMELEPSDLSWKEEIKKRMQTNHDFLNNFGFEEPIILSYYEFGGDIYFPPK
jgi:hypothetical protein